MEKGESSRAIPLEDEQVWAKLIPTDSRYSEIELRLKETVICSEVTILSSGKQEWCKITRNVDLVSAMMQNKSSKAILVDEMVVQDEHAAIIKCGSEISLGPNVEEVSSMLLGFSKYRFEMMPMEESRRYIQISLDVEHAKCCICLSIWHDVVTAAPCLHNFCNGCFSEWLRRSQEKRSSVLCPQCRAVVQFVGRNHFLHNIEEDILRADPSLKRSSEDIVLLNSCASIKSPLVLSSKRSRRKRERSPSDAANSWEHLCAQCGTEIGGYQCNESTVYLQCHACGGLGCDRAFCAEYWHSQGINENNLHPLCNPETFKPIAERTITGIPSLAHEKNQFEQNITERCIRQTGKSLQEVLADWILKFDNREIDRTRMPLNHAEMITSRTYTCSECYDKLVSFLLYWFRVTMTRLVLPREAAQREDCWYGYACRTQHHNQEHARKRNHVCRPTRAINSSPSFLLLLIF